MPKWQISQLPLKWLALSVSLVIIDQLAKTWVMHHLHPRETIPIFSGVVFHLCYNAGIGFSLLTNAGNTLILITSISILFYTCVLYRNHQNTHSWLLSLGLSFVIGGGCGNLYDRLTIGAVVDFIGIYFFEWKAPVFNLADVFINIGALFIILSEILQRPKTLRVF